MEGSTAMTRIDEIRERLDKVNLWMNQTQYGNVTYAYVTMLANAQDDLAWLLGEIEMLRKILNTTIDECNKLATEEYQRGINEKED